MKFAEEGAPLLLFDVLGGGRGRRTSEGLSKREETQLFIKVT